MKTCGSLVTSERVLSEVLEYGERVSPALVAFIPQNEDVEKAKNPHPIKDVGNRKP